MRTDFRVLALECHRHSSGPIYEFTQLVLIMPTLVRELKTENFQLMHQGHITNLEHYPMARTSLPASIMARKFS